MSPKKQTRVEPDIRQRAAVARQRHEDLENEAARLEVVATEVSEACNKDYTRATDLLFAERQASNARLIAEEYADEITDLLSAADRIDREAELEVLSKGLHVEAFEPIVEALTSTLVTHAEQLSTEVVQLMNTLDEHRDQVIRANGLASGLGRGKQSAVSRSFLFDQVIDRAKERLGIRHGHQGHLEFVLTDQGGNPWIHVRQGIDVPRIHSRAHERKAAE